MASSPNSLSSSSQPEPKEVDSDVEFKKGCVNKKFRLLDSAINQLIEVRNRHTEFCREMEAKANQQGNEAKKEEKDEPFKDAEEQENADSYKGVCERIQMRKDQKNIDAVEEMVAKAIKEVKETRNPPAPIPADLSCRPVTMASGPKPLSSSSNPEPNGVDGDVKFKIGLVNRKFEQLDSAINQMIEVRNRHVQFCRETETKGSGNQGGNGAKKEENDESFKDAVKLYQQKDNEKTKKWAAYFTFRDDQKNVDAVKPLVAKAIKQVKKTRKAFKPPYPDY